MKFDPTINLGHVLTILALVGSVFVAYSRLVITIENHEMRISVVEKGADRDAQVQQQILNTLTTIREDIATLKAQQNARLQ
ncbi:hypothetical protein [Pseudaminobacter soli (ex Li et al. 2025)]|uniref:Uncharacterized protein n=1 Tax=Pseudaminobacter soli (ex Li et al. 2025) TaxID=1295366 RepID=A0A2P7RZU1_9HYPH|nr:hypothetical protein [Mesorhizobium soli]PSJ55748.1 hypothetical protein C7I85_26010 [Mesorhizobium soli]